MSHVANKNRRLAGHVAGLNQAVCVNLGNWWSIGIKFGFRRHAEVISGCVHRADLQLLRREWLQNEIRWLHHDFFQRAMSRLIQSCAFTDPALQSLVPQAVLMNALAAPMRHLCAALEQEQALCWRG